MTKLETWLGGVLAVQLLLAAAFIWADRPDFQAGEKQDVLHVDTSQVDKLVITDGDTTAAISKTDDGWQLPDLQGLPASQKQVDQLLQRLDALKARWPVATSSASHKRFEVADDKFQRRISLFDGDQKLAELLVGTSPGLRQVHLRRAGDDAVYTGELPAYDAPARAIDWLDKTLLAPEKPVTAVEGPDYKLDKQDDQWRFADDSETPVDQEKARELVNAIASLRVTEPAEMTPDAVAEAFSISVHGDGESITFRFMEDGDDRYVRRDDGSALFAMARYSYDSLAKFTREMLTAKAEKVADAESKSSPTEPTAASD